MDMLIMSLCVSYATIASFVLYLGEKLDDWWDEESKRGLGLYLKEGVHQNPETWLKTINQAFLDSFDRVFGAKQLVMENIICSSQDLI